MPAIRLIGFSGEIPKLTPRLLPEGFAQRAFGARLEDGSLRPFRKSRRVTASGSYPINAPATIYNFQDEWLVWNKLVNAAPGPVTENRLYFTGDGAPKMRVSGVNYDLAIPAPANALTATASGSGTGNTIVRLYTYTNVSQFGEESQPAPLSNQVSWQSGQTVTLSGFSAAMGSRTVTKQRIYRSQTGFSGQTQAFLIAERSTGFASNFTDNIAPETFFEPVPSIQWSPPPDDMKGLVSMPNGIMAAFSGREILFSEPFIPHAWPVGYSLTTDYDIVALGVFGKMLLVMTTGHPYVVSGTHPDNMLMERLELNMPCINPAAVVDLGYSIAYPSTDGLVLVSVNGSSLVTEQLLSRSEWQRMLPGQFIAGQYNGRYMASFNYVDNTGEEQRGSFIFDLTGQTPFLIRTDENAIAFYHQLETGQTFMLHDRAIWEWDAQGQMNKTLSWTSKVYSMPKPESLGAALIEVDDSITAVELEELRLLAQQIIQDNQDLIDLNTNIGGELNGAAIGVYGINCDELQDIPKEGSFFVSCTVYGDGKIVGVISRENEMTRLPGGFLARNWEVEVTANMPITQITLAKTGLELSMV
jgi:hypothetical protein